MADGGRTWSVSRVAALLVAFILGQVEAEFCQTGTATWQCVCGCCNEYDYCCVSCGSYWYAWLLMTLLFLICLCACLGCGSYGYRRYRRPLPTSYTITPAPGMMSYTPGYGSTPEGYHGYKKTTPHASNYQPYQPRPAAIATGCQDYRQPNAGYHGDPASPSELPPPYNPNQAPPPYSTVMK